MLALGPVLIVTVVVLVSCETYWSLKHLVPMFAATWWRWGLHLAFIVFLVVNGMFNYAWCVATDPGTHTSKVYADLVHAASVEGSLSEADWEAFADRRGLPRQRKSQRVVTAAATTTTRGVPAAPGTVAWIDRGPFEWGFCRYTKGPKAPRAHFDHVTKKLVLNMDHYCPWMFNVVGYANYRYFVLFLVWVAVACVYGCAITVVPFLALMNNNNNNQSNLRVTFGAGKKRAKNAVVFTFVLALSVGVAVAVLGGWHIFLVLTGQTTIEFYGNHTLRQRAKARGHTFKNPYDRGCRRNWQHVFGFRHPLLAILPSRRPPPSTPWPSEADAPDEPRKNSRGPEFV